MKPKKSIINGLRPSIANLYGESLPMWSLELHLKGFGHRHHLQAALTTARDIILSHFPYFSSSERRYTSWGCPKRPKIMIFTTSLKSFLNVIDQWKTLFRTWKSIYQTYLTPTRPLAAILKNQIFDAPECIFHFLVPLFCRISAENDSKQSQWNPKKIDYKRFEAISRKSPR